MSGIMHLLGTDEVGLLLGLLEAAVVPNAQVPLLHTGRCHDQVRKVACSDCRRDHTMQPRYCDWMMIVSKGSQCQPMPPRVLDC
jgi:hypothetical protein